MINFVHGDMFATPADIRVNTVNCVGVMGAGMALAFKQRYPEMFKDYKRACDEGEVRPGKLHVWRSLAGEWVINFPTKRDWRDPSRYEYITEGLDALRAYLEPLGCVSVAIPALGCGHGGLDWNRVSDMIAQKLSTLMADLRVFAPSDSRRAGRELTEEPNQDELKAVEQLGYMQLKPTEKSVLDAPLIAKGKLDVLERRWIALLPSRDPGERELLALRQIAAELAQRKRDTSVALIYGNRATDAISQIFLDVGIHVLLFFPFGALTRKALARKAKPLGSGSLTLASTAAPNAKWSRAAFAEASELLRRGASAVVISDPSPTWLAGRSGWLDLPVFYVRYDGLPETLRDILVQLRASPIAKRPQDGLPNLDSLAIAAGLVPQPYADAMNPGNPTAFEEKADAVRGGQEAQTAAGRRLTVDLATIPASQLSQFIELILQARPRSMEATIEVEDEEARHTLERQLIDLSPNRS
jgi:O-acetyl-ADP-ribose deacetylase (regulator of RNase III)